MGKRLERTSAIALVLLYQLSYASIASAGYFNWSVNNQDSSDILIQQIEDNRSSFNDFYKWTRLIQEEEKKPKFNILKTYSVRATGYSSTSDQTDDTPFITASGTYVRDGIIAANFSVNGRRVLFGTMVRIPEIYGEKIFIVEDRMNARYNNNIDIWFSERDLAKAFGSHKVTIEIVELSDESQS